MLCRRGQYCNPPNLIRGGMDVSFVSPVLSVASPATGWHHQTIWLASLRQGSSEQLAFRVMLPSASHSLTRSAKAPGLRLGGCDLSYLDAVASLRCSRVTYGIHTKYEPCDICVRKLWFYSGCGKFVSSTICGWRSSGLPSSPDPTTNLEVPLPAVSR